MKITESAGNVFIDLGFSPEEAANLTMRSELMVELRQIIRKRKLTQTKAARLFGVSQPRISDLVRGKIDLFSVDTLLGMLWRAGLRAEMRLKAA